MNAPTIGKAIKTKKFFKREFEKTIRRLFREYNLRGQLSDKFPEFAKRGAMRFYTGAMRFEWVDEERHLLIGDLGWLDDESPFWRHMNQRSRVSAMVWLQEKIGFYAQSERLRYVPVIHPTFAEDSEFMWLGSHVKPKVKREKKPEKPVPTKTEVTEVYPVQGGQDLLKLKYPIRKVKSDYFVRKMGGDYSLSIQALRRHGSDVQEIPYGPVCTQLEIWAYNIYQQTGKFYIVFDQPKELCKQIGLLPDTKNYRMICRKIMDIVWSAQMLASGYMLEVGNVTPFLFAHLWDEEPAEEVTYTTKDGKTVTRRQVGNRKLSLDQAQLVPSVIWLNPVWLKRMGSLYQTVDLNVLNQLVSSRNTYAMALKCYDLGSRGRKGAVPFFGPNGLEADLGKKGAQKKHTRRDLKSAIEGAIKATGAPFHLDGDALIFQPWQPLKGMHRESIPTPKAMESWIGRELDLSDLKKARGETIQLLDVRRKEAMERKAKHNPDEDS